MTDPTPASTPPARPTFTFRIADRDIEFRQLNEMQIALIAQVTQRLKRGQPDQVLQAAARFLDMVQSTAVNPDDQQYMEDAMANGLIELSDMTEWFAQMASAEPAPATGPKPRVRRARK